MLLPTFVILFEICVSHPMKKHDKHPLHVPVFDGTDKTIPKTLKDNTIIDQIEEINDDEKKQKLFEADIFLSRQDKYERGVDTSPTGDATGAKVDVESIGGEKRKGIRTRRKIWPSRIIPVAATRDMGTLDLASDQAVLDTLRAACCVLTGRSGLCIVLFLHTENSLLGIASLYPGDARPNIIAAINEIQTVSCIRFKDKDDGDKHWVRFVKKNGCYSRVGREYYNPGAQEVSIGPGCNSKGIILHELMHAIGFWHEQSRTDRDNFLSVLWENVKPDQTKNFNKYPASEVDAVGGMYDFESIMHYGNYAFSKNRKPTLVALKNPKLQFGTSLKLSKTDIMQLNAIYDCKTPKGGWSSWTDWGPCDRKCTVIRERFCAAKDRSKCPGVDADGIQTQKKRCETEECNVPLNGHWGRWAAWNACSVTCGKGYQTRSRTCDDPPPQFSGNICEGMLVEVQNCKGKTPKCKKEPSNTQPKNGW